MKKIVFVNLVTIIALILILEILIRIFNLASLQGYDKNFFISENNITLNKPNSLLTVAGIKVKTDKNGYRIPFKKNQFKIDSKSILIMGDSVSFGFGVEEEKTFIGISRDETKSNLINTSVIGHNLNSYLYLLKKNINKFPNKFDKVVIFLCLNDIHLPQGVISKKDLKKINNQSEESSFTKVLKNNFFLKINVILREKSALFVFLKSVSTNSVRRHYDYMAKYYENDSSLTSYSNYIREIKNFSELNSIKIDFILLPYALQVIKNCERNYLKPQFKIKKIFENLKLDLHDFTDNFCQAGKDKNFFLGFDPVHLSKNGHKFVSRLIVEKGIIY